MSVELANQVCPAVAYQKVAVCVPVSVKPYAVSGSTVTTCCGAPSVSTSTDPCEGTVNGSCSFKIGQTLCIAVPVNFGADATVGNTYVNCLEVSESDICTDCTPNKPNEQVSM